MMRRAPAAVRLLTLRSGAPDVEEWQAVLLVGGMVRAAERGATQGDARAAVLAAAEGRGFAVPAPRRRFA